MTQKQYTDLSKAIRKSLQIGDRVAVFSRQPKDIKDNFTMPVRSMYVRELHNKTTAGLSVKKDSESIYGIEYVIIHPY